MAFKKRLKFGNKKVGGYDSKKESKRASTLKMMEASGEIQDLREQVKYELIPKHVGADGKVVERNCSYIADFVYTQNGELVVEDSKSAITKKEPSYIIKRKLMLFIHGIKIKET